MPRRDLGQGAWIDYEPQFLADHEDWKSRLLAELDLRVETIRMFGKRIPVPREVAYHADPGLSYCYSGTDHPATPWTQTLAAVRERLVVHTGTPYDAVLVNHYRTGNDSMGRHADDEPELGPAPDDIRIASISLGARRVFRLHPRAGGPRIDYELGQGDLLVMGGTTQRHFVHELVRTRRPVAPRLNLTFRCLGLHRTSRV